MSTGFNLREVTREVLRSSTVADPSELAGEVFAKIPKRMQAAVLQQLLPEFVRQVSLEERSHRPAPASGRSAKVSAIRDGWQRQLGARVHVGSGEWKFLRDCTRDDLLAAAQERRDIAERNAARAREYDGWARAITEHDVKTFGELPAEVLMRLLGGAE